MSRSPAAPQRRLLLAGAVTVVATMLWLLRGGAPVGQEAHLSAGNAPESGDHPSPYTVGDPMLPLPTPRTEVPDEGGGVLDEGADAPPLENSPSPTSPGVVLEDTRVQPVYTFWDDSGGPPMRDDELTLTLVEAADGVVREPWSASVELSAVRAMQPKYTVALPLPTAGLYRATCRDGKYEPVDIWVPNAEQPRVAIVLSRSR